jgi:hypothetical protein
VNNGILAHVLSVVVSSVCGMAEGATVTVTRIEGVDAGPVVPSLPHLMRTDVRAADAASLLAEIAEAERAIATATAVQHERMVELARRPFRAAGAEDPAEFAEPGRVAREHVTDELALALNTSSRAVDARLSLATGLVRLPVAAGLLRDGRLDVGRARLLVEETAVLTDALAGAVDAQESVHAPVLTPARLRRRVRRAVLAADAKAAKKREAKAKDARCVRLGRLPDGMAELTAVLPAVDAVRAFDVLTAAARRERRAQPGEERSLDQLRADLFADVFRAASASGELPGAHAVGAGVEIQVHAHATTMLGLDDEPGLLAGYGPITAAAVRELAPGARMRRLLVEPVTGKVLDVGRTSYQPTADIARHVRAVHPRCTFPSCEQPARRSELDHVLPFPLGPTSADNLRPRCKRHHLLKHQPLVHVEELPDGATRWHLPTGTHDNAPEPSLPPPDPEPPPDDPPF